MNPALLEAWLARLYADGALRRAFLDDPERTTRDAGLDEETRRCLLAIDREGLVLAAHSAGAKRAAHARARRTGGRWAVLRGVLARVRDGLAGGHSGPGARRR